MTPAASASSPQGTAVACPHYSYAAEIYRQNIKGGVCGALEDTGQSAYKGIGTVCGHGIYHQPSCPASAQRFHQRRRERSYEITVDTA